MPFLTLSLCWTVASAVYRQFSHLELNSASYLRPHIQIYTRTHLRSCAISFVSGMATLGPGSTFVDINDSIVPVNR